MSGARGRQTAPGAVDILEEATHLIRLAPAGTLAPFYAGSVPFVLALLYFWSDMSRNALARRHVVTGSLVVAVLYIWMKAWQAVFARRLRARLSGEAAPRPSHVATARLLLAQAALQPTSLFVLPIAGLALLPYGWAYAFYQNLGVLGNSEAARRQALLWPRQNHAIIGILTLLGFFVFLNIAMTIAAIPYLLKTLLGVESAFSASPVSLLNTTFLLIACGLTYLVTAPLARAAYVVRCFHGESLSTGEDLKAELRALRPGARKAAAIVVLTLALCAGAPMAAASGTPGHASAEVPHVPPAKIDRAVRDVIARREFAWRLPHPPEPRPRNGVVARFLSSVADMTMDALRVVGKWIGRLVERLVRSLEGRRPDKERPESLGWLTSVQGLLALLLAVVACAAAIFFWRSRRRSAPMATLAGAVAAVPDLSVDDSAAAEMPAESWLERARDLARQGDLRQAVRALYLGCLSHLAARELLTLARFKSNRDYLAELMRRGRTRPELGSLFAENVALFERTWYGTHEATQETLRRSMANFERMRVHALE